MCKVLVIDDSVEFLEMLRLVLETKGHTVECAASKTEGLYKMNLSGPDIILLDVRLHGHDGRLLCKEIKSSIKNPPVIFLLSASAQLLTDYTKWLADDIIEKPFNIHVLYSKIDEYCVLV